MLFKEPKIEPAFERHAALFKRAVDETYEEIKEHGSDIGEGKTATIKVSDIRDFICLKVVDYNKAKKNSASLTNKVYPEIDFMDRVSDVKFLHSIGIRRRIAPRPMYAEEIGDYGFLFMQKIKGFTIKEWQEDPKFKDSLPKNFSWESFFTELEDIINKLNKANIYHRDLHGGNIFIDEKGRPIIIDYGDAIETFLTDEDPYREDGYGGKITLFRPDTQYIKELKNQILTQ